MTQDYGKKYRSNIIDARNKEPEDRNSRLGISMPNRKIKISNLISKLSWIFKNQFYLFLLSILIGWVVSMSIFYITGYFHIRVPLFTNFDW